MDFRPTRRPPRATDPGTEGRGGSGGALAGAAGEGGPPRLSAVAGGDRRQDSVAQGLAALGPGAGWALVHDAARPLVEPGDIRKLIAAVRKFRAAALGHPA